jgi:hypothetical protein
LTIGLIIVIHLIIIQKLSALLFSDTAQDTLYGQGIPTP